MRIIPKIEIKNDNLVKGIGFEGLRVLGDPKFFIDYYNKTIADEFFIIDVVPSLYGTKHNFKILENFCKFTSVPITVSGGLRHITDIDRAFSAGADKVSLNTILFKKKNILDNIINKYGSQAVSANLEVFELSDKYYLFSGFGKEQTGIILEDKIKHLNESGIGEIIVSSIKKDGSLSGVDYKLLEKIEKFSNCPILYSGGVKNLKEIYNIKKNFNIDGLLVGSLFHYNLLSQSHDQKEIISKSKIGNKDFVSERDNLKKIPKLNQIDFKSLQKRKTQSKKNLKINNVKSKICILDLEVGNVFSLKNFLKKFNFNFIISDKVKEIKNCDLLIISGDCNASFCLDEIKKKNLTKTINEFFEKKKLIGICSGMQIMFEDIYEGKKSKGLSLFKGSIKKIKLKNKNIKLPNIGWRKLRNLKKQDNIKATKDYYFLHSYSAKDYNRKDCLYLSDYKGVEIPSIFFKNKTLLFQFHPEKSGDFGHQLFFNSIRYLSYIK